MTRPVVGMPGLGLKLQEQSGPTACGGKKEQQSSVLPHTIVIHKSGRVSLIHVDVMNAVAGQEAEDLVAVTGFRPPSLSKSVDDRVFFTHCFLHQCVDYVVQVVV